MRDAMADSMESWQKQLLGERHRGSAGIGECEEAVLRTPKSDVRRSGSWLAIRGPEKIKDAEDRVLLRSTPGRDPLPKTPCCAV
jgi:hypothetical protein